MPRINNRYEPESLLQLLMNVDSNKEKNITHYDLVNWCEEYSYYWNNKEDNENITLTVLQQQALNIAQGIECQWDLYLVNTYTVEELNHLNLHLVEMPGGWFKEWLGLLLKAFNKSANK